MSAIIYHGDCLEVMCSMPGQSVDAVITDPPFAMAGGISNGATSSADSQFFEYWLADVAKHLVRIIRPAGCMAMWCDWRTVGVIDRAFAKASQRYEPWYVSQVLVHDREMIGMGSPFRNQCDWIAVLRGRKTDFGGRIPKNTPNLFRAYSYYGKHANHPAEKTVEVAGKIVEWCSPPGGLILDPFCGSGTTGVAAVLAGRRFVGIERDEAFAETSRKRLEDTTPQGSLLDDVTGGAA